jgi:hypothetical protein
MKAIVLSIFSGSGFGLINAQALVKSSYFLEREK